jgi:hypothetical protein
VVTRLTTLDRVKRRAGIKGQEDDQLILEVIDEVSDDLEAYLGRHIQELPRTEIYRVHYHTHLVRLVGYPVADLTQVKYHLRADEWDSVTAMNTDLYTLDADTGTIRIRPETPYDPGYLQVIYRGGLVGSSGDDAETLTASFVSGYPRRRRKAPTGSLRMGRSMVNHTESEFSGLLPDVRRRFNSIKRRKVF